MQAYWSESKTIVMFNRTPVLKHEKYMFMMKLS